MILQFGAGNFLRGFADVFIDELGLGPVTIVQSTGRERAEAINRSGGRYHVAIRGYAEGNVVDETIAVSSIGEALHAGTQWDRVLETGRDVALTMVFSNTTEAGLALDPRDLEPTADAPHSFPAKLLAVLRARFEAGCAGLWIVPCELIEKNADRLRALVLEQAETWQLASDLREWIATECQWANTLVDRIVPGRPDAHPLLETDPLLISAEPFAFWAVETEATDFPLRDHPAVTVSCDISSYVLRKVRILNGAHTALVCRARGTELTTVGECLENTEMASWLQSFLFSEVVPVLEGRCEDPAGFARATLDRFRNPFLCHELSAIALHHETKVDTRLEPTRREFVERFGAAPPLLSDIL